ncbi:hypothetical protein [Streptosporangium lutulentum]|uniref:Uncharacterized protein n=1 Tax=Streptosporangium lutulentum TaxID=1461250 RepID=A0ABT9QNG5_9ACTN|nr:hypothetical protein [Streptosporangium lutulentum]MDP9848272.1 hypothetical protein [Streptosporangium lutulentum]
MTLNPWSNLMAFATTPTRRLITLGVALAVGATVLGAPAATAATPSEGAYWHTRELTTSIHPWRFGTDSAPYSLVQQEIVEGWDVPDGRSWFGYRELGSLPKSAADKKAWQRDGSPSTWDESIDGKTVKLSTKPSKGIVTPGRKQPFLLMEQRLTYDEVQRLPADPSRLKDWLTKAAQASREVDLVGSLTYTLTQLLYDLPAPKEVRAAAYQALLTLPGVRADGNAKDNLGRSGAAVVIERSSGTGKEAHSVKERLIVDTGRMVLLSHNQTGTVGGKASAQLFHDKTLIEVGWTDSRPAVPALP